ncbi:hypothetical protein [Paraburkholderia lycopersici]|nr:hypothetical protein [Paraburkholderia lycopersici]
MSAPFCGVVTCWKRTKLAAQILTVVNDMLRAGTLVKVFRVKNRGSMRRTPCDGLIDQCFPMGRIVTLRVGEKHQHPTRAQDCACRNRWDRPSFARVRKVLSSVYAVAIASSLGGAHVAYGANAGMDQPKEPLPIAAENPTWALQVTPYIWAAALGGHISPFRRGPTIGVEKSFSDVLDNLNFGGFANIWGRYDRFVFSADVMYVDMTDSHGSGSLPVPQIPGLGAALSPGGSADAKVDTKQFAATLQGGYRVVNTPRFTLDALAGMRFWYISNDVTVTASHPAIGTRSTSHSEDFGWVDPVAGVRVFLPVMDKLSMQVQADIGGFGAGSDLTWSALAIINYLVSGNLSVSVGYKVLYVDYDHGGHVYDSRLNGPLLGMTYRF